MLAGLRGKHPILGIEDRARPAAGRRALHRMRRGQLVDAERTRRIRRVLGQSADHELRVRAGGVFHRRDEIDEAIRSRLADRLAIRRVDRHAIDEHHAKIRIFGGALRRHIHYKAHRQHRCDRRIGNVHVQLKTSLGARLDRCLREQGLRGPRRPGQPRQSRQSRQSHQGAQEERCPNGAERQRSMRAHVTTVPRSPPLDPHRKRAPA